MHMRALKTLSLASISGIVIGAVFALGAPTPANAGEIPAWDCESPKKCTYGDWRCDTKCDSAKICSCTIS
jgi:hypothetical protein